MITERDTLNAMKNRWLNEIKERERQNLKAREGIQAIDRALNVLDGTPLEQRTEEIQEVVPEGPTGKELVFSAAKQYQENTGSDVFHKIDLGKIIRANGQWTKKTPLANMIFMTLKRAVEQGEVEEVGDGYRVKGAGSLAEEIGDN